MNLTSLETCALNGMSTKRIASIFRNAKKKILSFEQLIFELKQENKILKNQIRELIREPLIPTIKPTVEQAKVFPDKSTGKPKSAPLVAKKKSYKKELVVHEEITLGSPLRPKDAIFKGYRRQVVQEIVLRPYNICYKIPRYYSPSKKKYYERPVPTIHKGRSFGPDVKSFIVMLSIQGRVPENRIKKILDGIGIRISTGTISNILQAVPENIREEFEKAKEVAIEKEGYLHIDLTGIRVNGKGKNIACLCNKKFASFATLHGKSRLEILKMIVGKNKKPKYLIDDWALETIRKKIENYKYLWTLNENYKRKKAYGERAITTILQKFFTSKGIIDTIKTFCLLSYYKKQRYGPYANGLVSDDAGEFGNMFPLHQLCWIHEIRHYRLIEAMTLKHKSIFANFFKEFWRFFNQMEEFRQNPTVNKSINIRAKFDDIFKKDWEQIGIDMRRKKTLRNRNNLLTFLFNPSIPIHNNICESDIREKVMKRKISLGHRSFEGSENANFWLSLYHTCRKNQVSFWNFLIDRFSYRLNVPKLDSIIKDGFPSPI